MNSSQHVRDGNWIPRVRELGEIGYLSPTSLVRLAWALLVAMVRHIQIMNFFNFSNDSRFIGRILCFLACLFPSLLFAHPGHFHPDEVDEFDFFRATVFHSHGALDLVIAAVALGSVAMVCLHGEGRVRVAAALVSVGTIALLSGV